MAAADITRQITWKDLTRLSVSMFYHLEHHLFPAVPTVKLPELEKKKTF